VSARLAIVLGASSYLGGAVVRELAAAGCTVAATWRSHRPDLPARLVQLDASDPAALRATLSGLCDELGPPHAFVHCLTVGPPRTLAAVDDAELERLWAVNVRSAFIAAQTLAPRMSGGGDLVFTASLDGIQPVPAPAHFAATQGALLGMVRALAKELGPSGVRVNLAVVGVLEGGVASGLSARLLGDYKKFSALGRVGTADEVARALRHLALENRYMTGQILSLTGGI
jgi:3-oxoacyl-[acyl-carrier protein] reductase